jgi:hypothetical protein
MTRIFDAMRKAQAQRGTAAIFPPPPPVVVPHPPGPVAVPVAVVRPVPAPPSALSRGPLPDVEVVSGSELPEAVTREMNTLRIGIESALEDRIQRVIVFMGSQGGEGTTTVAAQFALLLAADPRVRVMLLDAHVARPAIARRFGLDGTGAHHAGAVPDGAALPRPLHLLPSTEATRRNGLLSPSSARESWLGCPASTTGS